MIKKSVYWLGNFITNIEIYDESDWKGNKTPEKKDFDTIRIYQSAKALHKAVHKYPKCPYPDFTLKKPWVQVLLQLICMTLIGNQDLVFEEQVMRYYLQKYGMDQLLEVFGVDVVKLKQEIDNMKAENS